MVDLCKRLSVEFMHFVIESRALRKVFCSIKGYYFQADIKVKKLILLEMIKDSLSLRKDTDRKAFFTKKYY